MARGKRGAPMSRKRAASKKRSSRPAKKARSAQSMNSLSGMVHKFSRYVSNDFVTNLVVASGSTGAGFGRTFSLSDVGSFAEFTSLYDQYRITGVVCYVQLLNNPDAERYLNQSANSNAANFYPRLWWSIDRDSAATPTLSEIKERMGSKSTILEPNKMVKIFLKPNLLIQTYGTAITTGYEPKFSWVDLANSNVIHYGMKFFVDFQGLTSTVNYAVRFDYKYMFECKQPR